jgi:hypothetical protein
MAARRRKTAAATMVVAAVVAGGLLRRRRPAAGTGRFTYHLDETAHDPAEEHGPPDELEQFTIPVPAGVQDRAVSAAVGVPVLVNE